MKKRNFIIIVAAIVTAIAVIGAIITVKMIKANEFYLEAYYAMKCETFLKENPTFESGQIVFIGDSITDGYDLDKYYDLPLEVYNRGIGGDTTAGVINRLALSLFDIDPTVVVLLIGINDLNSGKSASYVLDNYKIILAEIQKRLPDATVFIQSIYPVKDKQYHIEKSTEAILNVNSELKPLAESFGYTYIELFGLLADGNN
ncbi:MAG: GDSL-type esterase/lipase family protein, partial [Clostridiales bacterium]|nr:GDSL-type esterase/lipase family protein [Clostridiales bacterium]